MVKSRSYVKLTRLTRVRVRIKMIIIIILKLDLKINPRQGSCHKWGWQLAQVNIRKNNYYHSLKICIRGRHGIRLSSRVERVNLGWPEQHMDTNYYYHDFKTQLGGQFRARFESWIEKINLVWLGNIKIKIIIIIILKLNLKIDRGKAQITNWEG